jgi:hypothetical protein
MSSSTTFIGASFHLLSVAPVGSKVRVRFSAVPLQSSPAGTNDGLNPANYTLTGPAVVAITGVATVGGDPDALDLTCSPLLAPGTWVLTVANVRTTLGASLSPPTSLAFSATAIGTGTALTAGAENDDPGQVIRKHLSAAMGGPNWNALIAALGSGDDTNWTNAGLAFDQLFKSSASGKYLDRIMSNDGLSRPANVGMSDELYRELGIKLTNNKLTHEALREILEIFYGRDAMRAYAETSLESPYNLSDGLTLTWTLDETTQISHTFRADQFTFPSTATAFEIASALTKTMSDAGSDGFAAAVVNPTSGLSRVRIYSGSIGLKSFVRVTGGTAQPNLRFPAYKEIYSGTITSGAGYNWAYSVPQQNVTRISLSTVGQPPLGPDLSTIEAGDYVVIGANVGAVVSGTYPIRTVSYSWTGGTLTQTFELDVDLGVGTTSILQNANDNYRFFSPSKRTILNGPRTVVVAQVQPRTVDIQFPATTQAVSRTARTGSYPTGQSALSIERYWKDTSGLLVLKLASTMGSPPSAGQLITIDNVAPATSRPWISLGTPGAYPSVATADAGFCTLLSSTQAPSSAPGQHSQASPLLTGDLLITGGTRTVATVTSATANCNRYRPVGTVAVSDGSEADGATRQRYQWIATAAMGTARMSHGISTLADGRALVTGGQAASGSVVLNAPELYDPTSNTWTAMPSMTTARFDHRQITANNGLVIVLGGCTSASNVATATIERFNPSTLTWSAGASMDMARYGHNAVKLTDGRIFVTGGGQLAAGHIADSNSLALWRADEFGAGLNLVDATGTYTLTQTGSPTVVSGKIAGGRHFDGGAKYFFRAGDAPSRTAMQGEVTLSAWVRRTASTATDFNIFEFRAPFAVPGNLPLYVKIANSTGTVNVYWDKGTGGSFVQIGQASAFVVPLNVWSHIAARRRHVGGQAFLDLFFNGTTKETYGPFVLPDTAGGNNADFWVGAESSGGPSYGFGDVDDIHLSKVARTDAEILADFVRGWGSSNLNNTFNVNGATTNTTALYDPATDTWTAGPSMRYARIWHQMNLLPDGRVLVYGGWGRSLTEALPTDNAPIEYPNNGLASAEIWDPDTNQWSMCEAPSQVLTDCCSILLPGRKQIVAMNSRYGRTSIVYGSVTANVIDPNVIEVFDAAKKRWKKHFLQNSARRDYGWHVGNDVALIAGGNTVSDSYTNMDLWVPGYDTFSGGGINGPHEVVSSTSSTITVRTRGHAAFATNFGDVDRVGGGYYVNPAYNFYTPGMDNTTASGYRYNAGAAQRTSGVVTLTLGNTSGLSASQKVFVNTNHASFGSGVKTLLSVTSSTVTYAEAAGDIGATGITGVITVNQNPGAIVTINQPLTAVGPYIFDPDAGVAITRSDTVLQTTLRKGQQVDRITVASTADFPDRPGYLTLAFGTALQSRPIRYLEKVGTNILLLDFNYVIEQDYPATTTKVSLLNSREPYVPTQPLDSSNFYATGSSAGRIAAQATTEAAAAAGIALDFNVVYPGDRGLGGEGYPTEGDGKLSDVARIWGGDE